MMFPYIHQVLRLHLQLLLHKVVEVIGRQDDGCLGQCPLSIDIRFAELFLADGDASLLIPVPDNVSPMAPSRIECAAIIKYQSLYETLPLPLPAREGSIL